MSYSIHRRFSVHTLLDRNRLQVEGQLNSQFSETRTVKLSSGNHTWQRSQIFEEPEILGEARCFPMVEPLDEDLRFRTHLSFDSSVSQTLMDKFAKQNRIR